MKGNLFLQGAVPAKMEIDPQVDSNHNVGISIVEEAGSWYLQMNVSEDWARQRSRTLVYPSELEKTAISHQSFVGGSETPKVLNRDYLGNKRSRKNSYPGAIEFKKGGMQKLKVY